MKPTVSVSRMRGIVAERIVRTVESSVANRRSSATTCESVRAFMSVDLPEFV
jgi:hypothetical protein